MWHLKSDPKPIYCGWLLILQHLKTLQHFVQNSTKITCLQQHPEEISEDTLSAGARGPLWIAQVVKHVGDAAREGQHDDEEGDQEHQDVLQHDPDAQNDRAEVFWHDPGLDALQDGEREGDAPEDPPRCLHRRNATLPLRVHEDILEHPDDEADQEEAVRDDVVVIPEREVALLEPPHAGFWLLHPPEEQCRPDVATEVGGNEDGEGGVYPIDEGRGGLVNIAQDQGDEETVGESRVYCPI